VFWNPLNGVTELVVTVVLPPPSQLISRRPPASGPGVLPLFGLPRAALKTSTVVWIEDGLALPPTENVTGTAAAKVDTPAVAKQKTNLTGSISDLQSGSFVPAKDPASSVPPTEKQGWAEL
jgi:hypothetical protein